MAHSPLQELGDRWVNSGSYETEGHTPWTEKAATPIQRHSIPSAFMMAPQGIKHPISISGHGLSVSNEEASAAFLLSVISETELSDRNARLPTPEIMSPNPTELGLAGPPRACEKHKKWKKRCPDDCPLRASGGSPYAPLKRGRPAGGKKKEQRSSEEEAEISEEESNSEGEDKNFALTPTKGGRKTNNSLSVIIDGLPEKKRGRRVTRASSQSPPSPSTPDTTVHHHMERTEPPLRMQEEGETSPQPNHSPSLDETKSRGHVSSFPLKKKILWMAKEEKEAQEVLPQEMMPQEKRKREKNVTDSEEEFDEKVDEEEDIEEEREGKRRREEEKRQEREEKRQEREEKRQEREGRRKEREREEKREEEAPRRENDGALRRGRRPTKGNGRFIPSACTRHKMLHARCPPNCPDREEVTREKVVAESSSESDYDEVFASHRRRLMKTGRV
ncbi:hypothetical protein PROFUN_01784 [Planoprotostelium fungivorum]|uniref:Uncharacterized protein n=1 Tax=Planoprotostelium fungivorum TaxID=1890364 RepID=A0A2P6MWJ5_9EUKA|nr:hypothetical protein PROFUN_01784 [Planoprotostelium fungivorum]